MSEETRWIYGLIGLAIVGFCVLGSQVIGCNLRVREMSNQLQIDCIKAGGMSIPISSGEATRILCVSKEKGVEK